MVIRVGRSMSAGATTRVPDLGIMAASGQAHVGRQKENPCQSRCRHWPMAGTRCHSRSRLAVHGWHAWQSCRLGPCRADASAGSCPCLAFSSPTTRPTSCRRCACCWATRASRPTWSARSTTSLDRVSQAAVRPAADGPQLHARHDVGARRARAARPRADARPDAAGRRDDRLGQHRDGRRSDAARRPQLRPEAVGRHHARRSRAARNRRRAGVAAARRAGSRASTTRRG